MNNHQIYSLLMKAAKKTSKNGHSLLFIQYFELAGATLNQMEVDLVEQFKVGKNG